MDSDQMKNIFQLIKSSNQDDQIEKEINIYIKNILKNGNKSCVAPITIKFYFNCSETLVYSNSWDTLRLILCEPISALQIFRTSVWCYANLLLASDKYRKLPIKSVIELQQVHCIIRLNHLPTNAEYSFVPCEHPIRLSMTSISCVLSGYGERQKWIRQSIWYCPCQCPNNVNRIIYGDQLTDENNLKCTMCSGKLKEYNHLRTTSDFCLIRVHHAGSVQTPTQQGNINRELIAKLSDELCDVELILGKVYTLIGYFDIFAQIYIAWNFHGQQLQIK